MAYRLAAALGQLGRKDEAAEALKAAIGVSFYFERDYESAVEVLERS
jgi:hypothetical protein